MAKSSQVLIRTGRFGLEDTRTVCVCKRIYSREAGMRLTQSCCCVGRGGSVAHGDKWQEQKDSLGIREKRIGTIANCCQFATWLAIHCKLVSCR